MSGALVGTTIAGGKYLIKSLLGAGGMGAVYEGEHVEIGKRVAVKVIDPSHAGSPEITARFKREARAASKVESDNIVQVFDIGQDEKAGLYMVMEFLSGEDLSCRLRRENRLEVPLAATIGVQTARALARAHAAGVIHRDLKPANLFLIIREDGSLHVKILDFGISKLTREEPTSQSLTGQRGGALTRKGVVIGTPQYMSPEQAQGLALDHRTDVWSLGAVLYEALSGVSAYEELSTYEQTIIQIVVKAPKPLAEVAPWVPAELAAIVHDALTHDVERRMADCATLARRLAEAVPGAHTGPLSRVSQSRVGTAPASQAHSKREPHTPQVVIRAPTTPGVGSMNAEDVLSSTLIGPETAKPAPAVTPPVPIPTAASNVPLALMPKGHTTSGVAVRQEAMLAPAPWWRRTPVLLSLSGGALALLVLGVGVSALRSGGAPAAQAAAGPSQPASPPAPPAEPTPTASPEQVAAAAPQTPPPQPPATATAETSASAVATAAKQPAIGTHGRTKAPPKAAAAAAPAPQNPPSQGQLGGAGVDNKF